VSEPDKPPNKPGVCPAPGRRRAASVPRKPRPRASRRGDACVTGRPPIRSAGTEDAALAFDPAGELEGFARWFADWWLRRGRELTSTQSQGGHDE
jgi:hypothetical protein